MTSLDLPDRPAWMDRGACHGVEPGAMFPGRGQTIEMRRAKALCARCEVIDECRDFAVTHVEHFGVWGGLSERERRVERKRRRARGELVEAPQVKEASRERHQVERDARHWSTFNPSYHRDRDRQRDREQEIIAQHKRRQADERHQEWAALALPEIEAGGDYRTRLAEVWEISRSAACDRLRTLRGEDLIPPGRPISKGRARDDERRQQWADDARAEIGRRGWYERLAQRWGVHRGTVQWRVEALRRDGLLPPAESKQQQEDDDTMEATTIDTTTTTEEVERLQPTAPLSWDEAVVRGRKLVGDLARMRWELGDLACEVAPVGPDTGPTGAGVLARVREFGEAIGVEYDALQSYRTNAHHWPAEHRQAGASWSVHQRMMSAPDRFDVLPRLIAEHGGRATLEHVRAILPRRSFSISVEAITHRIERLGRDLDRVEADEDERKRLALAIYNVAHALIYRPDDQDDQDDRAVHGPELAAVVG